MVEIEFAFTWFSAKLLFNAKKVLCLVRAESAHHTPAHCAVVSCFSFSSHCFSPCLPIFLAPCGTSTPVEGFFPFPSFSAVSADYGTTERERARKPIWNWNLSQTKKCGFDHRWESLSLSVCVCAAETRKAKSVPTQGHALQWNKRAHGWMGAKT